MCERSARRKRRIPAMPPWLAYAMYPSGGTRRAIALANCSTTMDTRAGTRAAIADEHEQIRSETAAAELGNAPAARRRRARRCRRRQCQGRVGWQLRRLRLRPHRAMHAGSQLRGRSPPTVSAAFASQRGSIARLRLRTDPVACIVTSALQDAPSVRCRSDNRQATCADRAAHRGERCAADRRRHG